ncbi:MULTISPECIES: trypsin-like peptidase domain-containing protein [Methylosinus]|uniref:FHA domain-containing protein n=1 Tax=Methylosinus sporium TaxID=428 RepID=A0A2U1SNH1_METSR|nr:MULTISPECIES: trypsin-like peptidase domain-containing protein [Methylosinus]MBU3886875.1 trypsin-like peptidase domain-containing protein [Methylosinus sp. KRF6]PWB93159.1 phosphopeptide-binding protein [Methylosinus sporium]TRL36526.1 FHA domain-containing protein [Methylosinus sporium]
MVGVVERVVIRHLAGSKANQIEQLPIGDLKEITIGRDPTSKVAFDPTIDGVVSRQHAVIRIEGEGDDLKFKLIDLNSSNGTFLNGQRISQDAELLPEDKVELGGAKGPKFTFDLQPRPASFAARTRVIGIDDSAATRLIETAQTAASTAVAQISSTSTEAPPHKAGVGQETVQRLIVEERRSVSRTWGAVAAGLLAFIALGGGAVYWKQIKDDERHQADLADVKADAKQADQRSASLQGEVKANLIGMTPLDIYNKYSNATARIDLRWRLFDTQTGKPIFHQTFRIGKDTLPAYVRFPNGKVVRWLTLEDDQRSNLQIAGEGHGSGFVVGEQGYLLTNKHVAAGWKVTYDESPRYGFLFDAGGGPGAADAKLRKPVGVIDLASGDYVELSLWVPEAGGVIFPSNVAKAIGRRDRNNIPDWTKNEQRSFEGRNEMLDVRFPGARLGVNATLVRASSDSDAALIKIDSPQILEKVELAEDDTVTIGEKVIVLGYPGVSVENVQRQVTVENGLTRVQNEVIPEATVTDGIVSKLSTGYKEKDGVTLTSAGERIQLSVLATGSGNSGGPVFNANGKVIGLFTYSRSRGDARVTLAVPIKFGRDLLRAQRN